MCIFCQIVKKEIPSPFVFEDEQMVALKDISPKASVHLLIVPKKHIESIAALAEEDKNLVAEMIWRAKILAEERGIAEGGYKLLFNVGENGGQAVKHLHLHLVGGEKLHWTL